MHSQSKSSISVSSRTLIPTNDLTPPIAPTNPPLPPLAPTTKVLIVWKKFTKMESVDPNKLQAKCNYCGKVYGCHHMRHKTSHLKVQ